MEAIIFDQTPGKLAPGNNSFALRAAYLIADSIVAAGDLYLVIDYEYCFNRMNLPYRFLMLQDFYKGSNDTQSLQAVAEMQATYKNIGKKKSKSSVDMVMLKKIEKSINAGYDGMMSTRKAQMSQTGLLQLQPLVEENVFEYRPTGASNSEASDDNCFPASEILTFTDKENTGIRIFCLQAEFFTPEFLNTLTVASPSSSDPIEPNAVWFEPLFTFPNLNAFIAPELLAARNALRQVAAPFCKTVDQWVGLCRGGASPANSLAHFKQHVAPASVALNESIRSNASLNRGYDLSLPGVHYELLFGEIPHQILLDFYHYFEIIKQPTSERLDALKPSFAGRLPVIMLRYPLNQTKTTQPQQQEFTAVKKSISLD